MRKKRKKAHRKKNDFQSETTTVNVSVIEEYDALSIDDTYR